MTAFTDAMSLTVPGPRPILGGYGNLLRLVRDPVRIMGELFLRCGPVANLAAGARVRLFSPLPQIEGVVFVTGPELLRQISTQHSVYHRRQMTGPLTPRGATTPRQRPLTYWGAGLIDLNDADHRRARRLMLPAFHKKRVETYRDQIVILTQQMLDRWTPGTPRDVHADLVDLTMRIATSILFGVDPAGTGERAGTAIQHSLALSFQPATLLVRLDLPGMPYRRFLTLVAQIEQAVRTIIADKRAHSGDDGDALSILMQAQDEDGAPMSEDELVAHAELLFIAAHETSSNALAWTLFLLSQHPQIVADLLDELDGALHGDAPTVEHLRPEGGQLPLLERVIKESMRLLPPVPWNARVVAQPSELGGYHIPANTEVVMSIYHTHHDPALYPDPARFDPARWEARDYGIFEYVPFSGGPRMCIGATFALMEIKIVLAMLLQRFRFELVAGARIDRLVTATMGPRSGVPMVIRPQDRQFSQGVGTARGNVREMVAFP
jgi:cytochrome P450